MAENRREYVVAIGDLPHTMLMDDADAERYGDRAALVKQPEAEPDEKAAPKPANKSRTARNK